MKTISPLLACILSFSALWFYSDFKLNTAKNPPVQPSVSPQTTCLIDLGEDIMIQLGDSVRLEPVISCPEDSIESIIWTPPTFLSCNSCWNCSDCLNPFSLAVEDQCYTLTINWMDGSVSVDDICVTLASCDPEYDENAISGISPQQINDLADITLEIAQTQFVQIDIVDNGSVLYEIWEGWLRAGLREVSLDFSDVPANSYELRVELYPTDQFINIEVI